MKLLPDVVAKYNAQTKLKIVEGSSPAAVASMKSAIDSRKPVVTASWMPNWAFAAMPIKALDDDLNAFPKPDSSHIVLSKKFGQKHPEIRKWMSQSALTEDQLASLMLEVTKTTDPVEAARKWLDVPANRQVAESWTKH